MIPGQTITRKKFKLSPSQLNTKLLYSLSVLPPTLAFHQHPLIIHIIIIIIEFCWEKSVEESCVIREQNTFNQFSFQEHKTQNRNDFRKNNFAL